MKEQLLKIFERVFNQEEETDDSDECRPVEEQHKELEEIKTKRKVWKRHTEGQKILLEAFLTLLRESLSSEELEEFADYWNYASLDNIHSNPGLIKPTIEEMRYSLEIGKSYNYMDPSSKKKLFEDYDKEGLLTQEIVDGWLNETPELFASITDKYKTEENFLRVFNSSLTSYPLHYWRALPEHLKTREVVKTVYTRYPDLIIVKDRGKLTKEDYHELLNGKNGQAFINTVPPEILQSLLSENVGIFLLHSSPMMRMLAKVAFDAKQKEFLPIFSRLCSMIRYKEEEKEETKAKAQIRAPATLSEDYNIEISRKHMRQIIEDLEVLIKKEDE